MLSLIVISNTPFSFWIFPENCYMIFLKINNWVVSCCSVFLLKATKVNRQNLNCQIKQAPILSSYFQSQGSEIKHPYPQPSTGLDETLAEHIMRCSPFAFWEKAYLLGIGVFFSLGLKRSVELWGWLVLSQADVAIPANITMSGDIEGSVNEYDFLVSKKRAFKGFAEHPKMHRTDPTAKNYPQMSIALV